jgi:hypothetical protein
MIEEGMLLLLGIIEASFEIELGRPTQKGRHDGQHFSRGRLSDLKCLNRRRAARSRKQMSNLVIGVVAACQASRRATSVKDGACGTKLLNGLYKHQWQAGLLAAARRTFSNATNANQRKPVSWVIAPPRRRLVC